MSCYERTTKFLTKKELESYQECPSCGGKVDQDGLTVEPDNCGYSPTICDKCGWSPCDGSC